MPMYNHILWGSTGTNPRGESPMPGYEGIVGNETADQLARTRSKHLFIGPKPACSTSVGVAKKSDRDWTNINHKKHIGNP
jgi:muramidase (phage lysozyme)